MNPRREEDVDEQRDGEDAEGQAAQCRSPTRNERAYASTSPAHTPAPAFHICAGSCKLRNRVQVPSNGESGDNELTIRN